MSSKIDTSTTADIKWRVPADPNASWFEQWLQSHYEGRQIERMAPKAYCLRSWTLQTGRPPGEATADFLEACIEECAWYKRYAAWSNKNI